MARFKTDCIERRMCMFFEMMGHFIGSHPWWFLIVPLVLSASLGSGFIFLQDRMSNNIEEEFTPFNGQAKRERKYIQETFPGNDLMFSYLRLSTDGNFATFIAASDRNILTVESLQDILDLDFKVRNMLVHYDNQSFKYSDVCAKVSGSCTNNDILEIIDYNATHIDKVYLTFPWYISGSSRYPLYLSLGSVTFYGGSSFVQSAKAIQLYYHLREDNKTKTDLWLESFINLVSKASSASIQVSYSTSMSMQWEFEKSPDSVISLFSITYTIVITFSILSCWRLDNVRTKVWVATCGVLSTGLGVLSGFGAMLLVGQPFVMTVASCPFMILGIGLDDMFIMVSCWQRTRVLDSIPDRLADTYKEAAISITITTLTDALALFLGYNTPFGSVQSFCLYAGVSICFCYLYCITFLGACMALNGQREEENKHWFTCAKIPEDLPSGNSKAFSICCVGGSYDRMTEKEETEPMSHFFEKFYGPFLTHKITKVCVFLIYAGYLAVSIYGCVRLEEGLDTKNLALDDSYIINYYDSQRQHFSEYSSNVMVAVTQPLLYWKEEDQNQLQSCISNFESLNYVNSTVAWFLIFEQYANATHANISSQEAYLTNLNTFLKFSPMFKQDINFTGNEIQASRFFIQTLKNIDEGDMLIGLRKTAEDCPIKLLVYHPSFIYFDQYTVIADNTIQTMLVAVAVMLVISLLLIPHPLCSIWVCFAIASVIVGVTGFMVLWGVNLDSISMINLVMCIGFSVDFSAHISYAFVSSQKSDVNEKAIDALANLGYPVVQGALSTILGVVVLSMSGSYIFRTFFKIVFLVITFGLLHGLMFIPVFLTLFGICGKWC
ncbi:Patched domain-containing protein 3 RND-type protein RNDEu-3 [Larimichthys crocea]|uniref:Patched domain-containing protein 3 n=2 Tax=Larimichthys crocea TaxID=215358 RepID=A0A6G0IJ86_LARCR|nr:Patched domain-containing protein 3 RND-type protein RNDEu-3 [Larimichthys crocea]